MSEYIKCKRCHHGYVRIGHRLVRCALCKGKTVFNFHDANSFDLS